MYIAYGSTAILGLVVYKMVDYYYGDAGNQTVFNISIGLILISAAIMFTTFEEKLITKDGACVSELELLEPEKTE
jgi:hypothetical protein